MCRINIGGQGFDELREQGAFYIDKTSFIRDWWEDLAPVTLITRPRRFGKTLNMRMLECFFSNQYAGRSDLFEGLEIWADKKYRDLQGTYPVIFLSFADVKAKTYAQARNSMIGSLQNLFQGYKDLWEKEGDTEIEKQRYRFLDIDAETADAEVARSLQRLTNYLQYRYGKKALIFLDEYDTPLQEAFINGYWDEMSVLIRSLFNSTFKTNPSMERAVMTGITRVSKESMFSDLNNLNVITTTSSQYETAFGFTEKEVFHALDEFGLSSSRENVRIWYDGFTFGTFHSIYNPWSILNYLKNGKLAPYWANTSSNGLISYELRASDNRIKHQMETLMNGGSVNSAVDEQIVFTQLGENTVAIWSLLLSGGYLKILGREFDGDEDLYTLALTNHEVTVMFRRMIRDWFQPSDSFSEFTGALVKGNQDLLNYYLNDLLLNVASSFDTRQKVQPGHEPESFYHGLVLGLIAVEKRYIVTSNRESGLGRYDVTMKPRAGENCSGLPAVVIEFKVFDRKKEKDLEETADRALAQIRDRKYDAELLYEGIPSDHILHYGMAFCGKEALVKLEKPF